ncbi:MAG: Type 1 glutamine amidotransferase-like domain-containing protein [Bacilli bacterium]|nr:Type 1 glutamine amidotransferase-like domain-containing protein [Bacilli bacterium]
MKAVLISGSFKGLSIPKEVVEFINKHVKFKKCITFIASDFEDYEGNKKFTNKLVNLFEEQSIIFEKVNIIDCLKTKEEMHSNLIESNLVFLLGGDTLKQIEFINKFSLKELLKKEDKIILGISAGAINLAKNVVLAKDESDNIPELSMYEGIGITDINIEPHCDFRNQKHFKELEEASLYSSILLMNDDCFIIIEDDKYNYYGSYIILNKKNIYFNNKKCTLEDFLVEINYD